MKYETVKDIYEECSLMRTLENSDKKFYMDIQLLCKDYIQKINLIEKMKEDVRTEISRHSNLTENTLVYLLNKWELAE